MTAIGGVTRYKCPLPGCGWTLDVPGGLEPMGVEYAIRVHADEHGPLEYLRALLALTEAKQAADDLERPLAVGDALHGFCGGYLGRDHYDCCRVEALGPDWVVTRTDNDIVNVLGFASGAQTLLQLRRYRQESDYCHTRPCPVQPTRKA